MLTTIPFAGFYNSFHDDEIDQTIKQMFADRDTGCHENDGLEMALFRMCDYGEVFKSYARAYSESFAEEFELKTLKFESLKSPREYNFETDRIFCTIDESEAREILAKVDPESFETVTREMFTSRDGFSSFYSPDMTTWGDLATWDHNQLGALMIAHAGKDFDQYRELDLMEYARCNGELDRWIGEATPGIERLYKIHDYLETRAHRS